MRCSASVEQCRRSVKLVRSVVDDDDDVDVKLKRVHKLKCLGCYFAERSCRIDHCYGISKFYGNFNNVLAVTDQKKNETATLHLVKTYCLPTMLYGCEIWYPDRSDHHRFNVVWNISFRRIFGCCWRESASCLVLFWGTPHVLYG